MSKKKASTTPAEALAAIKEAAARGDLHFASDSLTTQFDAEIQRIFRALYIEKNGREPKRGIWAANGTSIGLLFDWNDETKSYDERAYTICRAVGERLGIELTPKTLWEDAAAALRAKERTEPVS